MEKGNNYWSYKNILYEKYSGENKHQISKCIFLSHKNEDKDYVREVADFIMECGIDIYFDEKDHKLQEAIKENNPEKITRCIEEALVNCTHILCVTSERTIRSWWVPYEIGFGKHKDCKIATLKRKDSLYHILPEYLEIQRKLITILDLVRWLDTDNSPNDLFSTKHQNILSLREYLELQ